MLGHCRSADAGAVVGAVRPTCRSSSATSLPTARRTLVTRGMLDLAHRGVWPSDGQADQECPPRVLEPGRWFDVAIELEATTWSVQPGPPIRLAIAGTDWPNCWPAPGAYTLEVAEVVLSMPVLPPLPDAGAEFAPGSGPSADDREGVEWRHEHDVLRRETWVHTRYGGPYDGADGLQVTDHYEGHVGISTADPSVGWARGTARFELALPGDGVATTEAVLDVSSDADSFHVAITLTATHDGEPFGERRIGSASPSPLTRAAHGGSSGQWRARHFGVLPKANDKWPCGTGTVPCCRSYMLHTYHVNAVSGRPSAPARRRTHMMRHAASGAPRPPHGTQPGALRLRAPARDRRRGSGLRCPAWRPRHSPPAGTAGGSGTRSAHAMGRVPRP